MSAFADRITQNATLLLMIAVILYFIQLLFVVNADNSVLFFGTGILTPAEEDLLLIDDLGMLFDIIWVLCNAIARLSAGLSFAAVCFDEEKNIWFRVVSVAALMMIMFGGLNIGTG